MKLSPAGRLLTVGSLILSACGPMGASSVEAEPTATPNYEPLAAAACGGWIDWAQKEMDTFLEGPDASNAQSLCTVWLTDNWSMAKYQSFQLGQTAVVHIDEEGLPINDRRGYRLAHWLQRYIIAQRDGIPVEEVAFTE